MILNKYLTFFLHASFEQGAVKLSGLLKLSTVLKKL